jgi:hypothetical protein
VILADTGAVVALIDADDRHHERLRTLWEADPAAWPTVRSGSSGATSGISPPRSGSSSGIAR